VSATPAPESIRLEDEFASCCDVRMVAARIRVPVAEDGTVAFTVAARSDAPAPASIGVSAAPPADAGAVRWWLPVVIAVALIGVALVLRRRAVVRRRRRARVARR
jgi:hypothetical protein